MVGEAQLSLDDETMFGIDPKLAFAGDRPIDLQVKAPGLPAEVDFLFSKFRAELA